MQPDGDPVSPLPPDMADCRKRPFKVWDHRRRGKKSLVADSIDDLLVRGREKLEFDKTTAVSLVLETDGTVVDDGEYFDTLPDNTVFLLLQDTERWLPPQLDLVRTALTWIPRIVCQTMESLDLRQEAPCWKIADNRGQITILLQWGNPQSTSGRLGLASPTGHRTQIVVSGIGETPLVTRHKSPSPPPPPPHNYSVEHAPPPYGQRATPSPSHRTPPPPAPHIRLARQSSSMESGPEQSRTSSTSAVPTSTVQSQENQYDTAGYLRSQPPSHCDFHCHSMHCDGGLVRVKKSSATSPIQVQQNDQQHMGNGVACGSAHANQSSRRSVGHVRFEEAVKDCGVTVANDKRHSSGALPNAYRQQSLQHLTNSQSQLQQQYQQQQLQLHMHRNHHQHQKQQQQQQQQQLHHQHRSMDMDESSESEGDNTLNEEATTEKTLMLVDQLSAEKNRYLTIKDIGIILERLSSKIVDVHSMERRKESNDSRFWTLRATIRGDSLGDMGVIYRGHYHSISEYHSVVSCVAAAAATRSESQTVIHPGIQ